MDVAELAFAVPSPEVLITLWLQAKIMDLYSLNTVLQKAPYAHLERCRGYLFKHHMC